MTQVFVVELPGMCSEWQNTSHPKLVSATEGELIASDFKGY
jgi:hypothetical protein